VNVAGARAHVAGYVVWNRCQRLAAVDDLRNGSPPRLFFLLPVVTIRPERA